jgi:hypothetical protein
MAIQIEPGKRLSLMVQGEEDRVSNLKGMLQALGEERIFLSIARLAGNSDDATLSIFLPGIIDDNVCLQIADRINNSNLHVQTLS